MAHKKSRAHLYVPFELIAASLLVCSEGRKNSILRLSIEQLGRIRKYNPKTDRITRIMQMFYNKWMNDKEFELRIIYLNAMFSTVNDLFVNNLCKIMYFEYALSDFSYDDLQGDPLNETLFITLNDDDINSKSNVIANSSFKNNLQTFNENSSSNLSERFINPQYIQHKSNENITNNEETDHIYERIALSKNTSEENICEDSTDLPLQNLSPVILSSNNHSQHLKLNDPFPFERNLLGVDDKIKIISDCYISTDAFHKTSQMSDKLHNHNQDINVEDRLPISIDNDGNPSNLEGTTQRE